MHESQTAYWRQHYRRPHLLSRPWLDLSNEAVQAQTFSLALEAAGPVAGKRCLDVGCGWGRLALLLAHQGATAVTGVDQVHELVEANRASRPDLEWIVGNAADPDLQHRLPPVDLVFAVEILQYVPFQETVERLWTRVRPAGRIIGVVPNGDCDIVRSTTMRFEGRYRPPSWSEIRSRLETLPGVDRWAMRGLLFRKDQRLLPYDASPWSHELPEGAPPNRLLFIAVRREDDMLRPSR